MAKSALEILIAARELISVPERWTKGAMARDARGNSVPVGSKVANQFCSKGAVLHSCNRAGGGYFEAIRYLGLAMHDLVARWQDEHEHPEVLAAFDRAIELARQEEEAHGRA